MNNIKLESFLRLMTLTFSLVFVSASLAHAAPPVAPVITTGTNMEILMYNEFTGTTPISGASSTTGTVTYNNIGTIKDILNSGNFLGVEDGEFVFKDVLDNIEQYNLITGAGFF